MSTEVLGLSDNQFGGILVDTFAELVNLESIDIANNEVKGSIPPSLFEAPKIRLIYLSNNQMTGPLPNNYGSASDLRDLYLDGNNLTGEIPGIQEGQLPNLNEFLLQDNDFVGSMPDSICALRVPAFMLEDLWADCKGSDNAPAQIECSCCTQCVFDQETSAR